MSASVAQSEGRMTVSEFLDWGSRQPSDRWELVSGKAFAMSPERNRHVAVKGAAYRALYAAVRNAGLDCTVLVDGTTIVIDDETARRPDVSIQCGSSPDAEAMTLDAPTILVEVTSPSSIRTDTSHKFVEYFSLASVHHYLIIDPDKAVVVHHGRSSDGEIHSRILHGGDLELTPPGLSVSVSALLGSESH